MSDTDRERWDARHGALGLGIPMPPDALRGRLTLLPPPGRALDVACGRGAVAVWLAQQGFAVDAVDVSAAGLRSGRELAAASGVLAQGESSPAGEVQDRLPQVRGEPEADELQAGPRVEPARGDGEVGEPEAGAVRFLAADLDAGLPVAGPYAVVVCQRFRDPALYPALAAALAPGGLLVLTVLSEVDEEPGRFRARPSELTRAFAGLEIVAHEEGNGEATLLARARRSS